VVEQEYVFVKVAPAGPDAAHDMVSGYGGGAAFEMAGTPYELTRHVLRKVAWSGQVNSFDFVRHSGRLRNVDRGRGLSVVHRDNRKRRAFLGVPSPR
jgi:hypothetical protein